MPKLILFLFIVSISRCLEAQQTSIDSVIGLMETSDNDKLTMSRYNFIAFKYHLLKNDSLANIYVQKAIGVAVKRSWTRDELAGRYLLITEANLNNGLNLSGFSF
ncbi:MAG: hypothetical protein EOP48_27035 [Sphingobacteriales bacterium]|nr:MAG: hypothetical protein EOP48_27035 [Sphingobacteriales bacterium]